MDDSGTPTTTLGEADDDILITYEVSDETLEAAAAGTDRRAAIGGAGNGGRPSCTHNTMIQAC
jgi:hypothetical protein